MYYRKLQPIRDRIKYSDDLSKLLSYEIYQLLYKPLIDLLSPRTVANDRSSVLVNAFLSRTIYFQEGFVYGKFNAAISKSLRGFGGTFNNTKKAFKISLAQLPIDVRDAIARGSMAESQAVETMRKRLQELSAQAVVIPALEEIGQTTLEDLHKQFEKLTPEDLQIPVDMNKEQEEKIRKDYTESVHLEINSLSQEATERLRYRVEDAVGQGMRAEDLRGVLMSEHGVMANRAKFIARQETGLFVAKYRQVRYEDAGINRYQWSTSADDRVRKDHRDLNGRIFSFDNPPITDQATGARNNPGEDFGCRCVALPVILVAGPGKRPAVKYEIEGENLLETTEHKEIYR